jgi:hypothetical protein
LVSLLQFNKEAGRVIEDFKLRVVYIPANPPSPVPEGSEEGNSPMASSTILPLNLPHSLMT